MNCLRSSKVFKILNHSYLTKAFSFFSLTQALNGIVGLLLLALYTRFLPPVEFGKISLMWMFILVASILIDCRLNTAFSIKYYKNNKQGNEKNLYTILLYNVMVWCVIFTICLFCPSIFQIVLGFKISLVELWISFLLVIMMVLSNFYTNLLIVDQKPKSFFIVKLVFNIVLIMSSLFFLLILKSGYMGYLESYLISHLVIAFIGIIYFFRNYNLDRKSFSVLNLKALLKIGIPLVPDGLLFMLLTWSDRYMLNLYVGLTVVGIYTVGYRFAEVINSFIINPFGQALSPLIFQQFIDSIDKYKETVGAVMKYYWLVIIGISIAYFSVLSEVFQYFINPSYAEGYNVIGIVLLGIIFKGASNFLSGTVIVSEKTGYMFLFTFLSISLNILLNFLLIPQIGMYGAAVAILIAHIFNYLIIFSFTQKLVFINYDYYFITKSILFSLFFLIIIVLLSYIPSNKEIILGLKLSLFIAFILISYKYLGIGKFIKSISIS